jgi:hypothetical protein
MTIENDFTNLTHIIKGYGVVKGLGVVAVLTEDVAGLTYVARWVKTDSISDRMEHLYNGPLDFKEGDIHD